MQTRLLSEGRQHPGDGRRQKAPPHGVHLFVPQALACSGLVSLVWASWEGRAAFSFPCVVFCSAAGSGSHLLQMWEKALCSPWPGGEVMFLCGCFLPVCFFPFRRRREQCCRTGPLGERVFQPNVVVFVWLLFWVSCPGVSRREGGTFQRQGLSF